MASSTININTKSRKKERMAACLQRGLATDGTNKQLLSRWRADVAHHKACREYHLGLLRTFDYEDAIFMFEGVERGVAIPSDIPDRATLACETIVNAYRSIGLKDFAGVIFHHSDMKKYTSSNPTVVLCLNSVWFALFMRTELYDRLLDSLKTEKFRVADICDQQYAIHDFSACMYKIKG